MVMHMHTKLMNTYGNWLITQFIAGCQKGHKFFYTNCLYLHIINTDTVCVKLHLRHKQTDKKTNGRTSGIEFGAF